LLSKKLVDLAQAQCKNVPVKKISHEAPQVGVVSVSDHFRDGNVHLISNYWGLDSFLEAPLPDKKLTVAYVGTAAKRYVEFEEPARFADAERAWLDRQQKSDRLNYFDYCISGKRAEQIEEDLSGADVVFVGGGNTQYLHEQLQCTGADDIIRTLVKNGTWYLGKSAGAIVAGPSIEPRGFLMDSMASAPIKNPQGLGLTNVYPLPHIDTPSIMSKEYAGKSGWQHAIELSSTAPTAYILDNLNKEKHT